MTTISKNYALAGVELGFTFTEVENLRELFHSTPELSKVLTSPAVSFAEKVKILDKIFSSEPLIKSFETINGSNLTITCNFLKVLIKRNRLNLLDEILDQVEAILLEAKKTRTVQLHYVTMPTDEQLSKMTEILKKKLNCQELLWQFNETPQLLGGFTIDAGDLFLDYSIKGQLKEMKEKITGR